MVKKKKTTAYRHLPRRLEIVYEDADLLVVDKPAGLLTEGTGNQKTRTARYILTDYVRKGALKSRKEVFTVHRLDQWTSGVLVFAKRLEVKELLQEQWPQVEKKYLAVVHGQPAQKEGTIRSYLAEDKKYHMYSTADPAKGKLAQTEYKVLKETLQFSLLEVRLLTGRKNQIRVHLADLGHPVVGDRKYGQAGREYPRLALHALSISFRHPIRNEMMTFETQVPSYLTKLLRG